MSVFLVKSSDDTVYKAWQWTGTPVHTLFSDTPFTGLCNNEHIRQISSDQLAVTTATGDENVCVGDWILQTRTGNIKLVRNEDFSNFVNIVLDSEDPNTDWFKFRYEM